MKLAGKRALVTGGSKGIGAAIARKLAAQGAQVVINYARSAKEADAVAAGINATGGRCWTIQADLSQAAEAMAIISKAAAAAGGPIDILVNNAGLYDFRPVEAIDEEFIDRHFDLNVKAVILACGAFVKQASAGGAIVNLSSVVSSNPPATSTVYSATKGAIDVITMALAAELGPKGIRVNAVAPGFTKTEGTHGWDEVEKFAISRTPLGRVGQADEVAEVALFLASDDARWVTGEIVQAGGGLKM